MKRLVTMILCLMLIGVWGCGKKDKDKNKKAPPVKPPVEQPAPIDDKDIAVPADFEDDAEQAITAETYKKAIDDLEAELAADE